MHFAFCILHLKPSFSDQIASLRDAFDSLSDRRVLLFGGKGGVGKTTLASLATLHFASRRKVTLFSTDPASNLRDLFSGATPKKLTLEPLNARALYKRFLDQNLEAFLELGDRGTYLDREELRRFFELSIPGIDELMAWLRIGELAGRNHELLVVDTAPTGHTLRMLSSSGHFVQFEKALRSMQAKHTELVEQLARRSVRDAIDEFLADFGRKLETNRQLLTDPDQTVFVPVFLAEPWVVEQTRRLIEEVQAQGLGAPFAVLNQAPHDCDCDQCREMSRRADKLGNLGLRVVAAPRACVQLDSAARLSAYLAGRDQRRSDTSSKRLRSGSLDIGPARVVFFAGKGGVGKTTAASSVALQSAERAPDAQFTLISVDPAHSVRDVFARQKPPANLSVEIIDTRAEWQRLRDKLGDEIARAIEALTPKGIRLVHDTEVMQQLMEMAPPGADELFAIMRLSELSEDKGQRQVFVDTAPTGHFLRLLELPQTAGEWVREFMRLLLNYKDLIPAGSLGEQLVRASRALKAFEELLRSSDCATIVVMRPERVVSAETARLLQTLRSRQMHLAGLVANYLTPGTDCSCDQSRRAEELDILGQYEEPLVLVERRATPPATLRELQQLIPLRS